MCLILTAINPNSELKLVLASNRDEFYERPTKNMFWRSDKNILSGEDELKKGMWLGLNKNGSLAAVTNVRDFSDALIFLVALPNILGLYVLAPMIKKELLNYQKRLQSGEIQNYRETND